MRCLRAIRRIAAASMAILMLLSNVVMAAAAVPRSTAQVDASLAYTLKGLKHNLAVQNFYVATNYIYITQRTGSTTYLSRLKINGKTAQYVDEMKFLNAGHGQSLDMYTYNGINYMYLGCKPEESDNHFSLQIARVTYEAGKTYDYTELNRFTYMNYASDSPTSLGTTYRVAAGGNSLYTVFRIQTKEKSVTYSIYDTVALNRLLDRSKSVRMDSAEAREACRFSFTQTDSDIIRPNGSFQGIDMLESSKIFLSGGQDGDTPSLVRMSNTGRYEKLVEIVNVGLHEIEGLQCKDTTIYFLIKPDSVEKKNTQIIYSISEHAFG